MRHRLTHAYFDIDAAVVWATVEEDLVPLVVRLRAWLEDLEK
ncbi:MAG: HepT-like ribonuclease domain-containing protein [Vicinamibacterales bacterium]